MVLSMAIVRDRFEGIQVGKALARLMLVVGVAPSIAPLIGAQFLLLGLVAATCSSRWPLFGVVAVGAGATSC